MSNWQIAELAVVSYVAMVTGYLLALKAFRRHFERAARRKPVACLMCDRAVTDPERVTCCDMCQDAWLGEIGATR